MGGGGGSHISGVNLFQGDGAKLHFSIETYTACCFPGVPDSLPPLDPRIAYVSMFVTF